MTLNELLDVIRHSSREDWYKIVCGGGSNGPSFRQEIRTTGELTAQTHTTTACYTPDVSITMAWGIEHSDDFREPWAEAFLDPNPSSAFLDLFYNGSLVYRSVYVNVDGGRGYLPLPRSRTLLAVTEADYNLIRVVHELDHDARPFEDYFKRAGFKIQYPTDVH